MNIGSALEIFLGLIFFAFGVMYIADITCNWRETHVKEIKVLDIVLIVCALTMGIFFVVAGLRG